jgi:hypothetical protein
LLNVPAMNYLALLLCVAAACGSSRAGDDDDTQPDAAPACTAGSRTIAADADWTLRGVSARSLLASRDDADDTVHLALLDDSGAVELAVIPGAARYAFSAALADKPDGTRCAVATSSIAGVVLACEGAPPETATFDALDADHPPVPVWGADGTLSVFAQTYAAFTELRRTPGGEWSDIEEYESSISFPTDAVATAGDPVVCFIGAGGYPVVQQGTAQSASTLKASTCKIAVEGGTVHVVAGGNYAAVPLSQLSEQLTTFTPAAIPALAGTVARVVVGDEGPQALVVTEQTLSAVALPTGTPTTLATAGSSAPLVGFDAATGTALLVSRDSAGVTVATACP